MNNKGRQKSDLIKVLKKERPIKIEHKNFLRDENNLFFFDFRRKTIDAFAGETSPQEKVDNFIFSRCFYSDTKLEVGKYWPL